MVKWILHFATGMLVVGYLLHGLNFYLTSANKMCVAMVLFSAAMLFLFA